MLTHLKEKLQFVQGENQREKAILRDVEAEVAQVFQNKSFNLYSFFI